MKLYFETKLGKLYHGDCLEIMEHLQDNSINMIIIDPPYSSGTRQATNRTASNIPKRGERWNPERAGIMWDTSYSSFGLSVFMNTMLNEAKRLLIDKSHIYCFIDWRQYPLLSLSFEHAGLFINNLLVWDKTVYALGGNYRSQHELIIFGSKGPARELNKHDIGNVLSEKRVINGDHPTEKPIPLIRMLIEYATNKNDIIADFFLGSGTTAIACEQLNRKWIATEKEKKYCTMAAKRIIRETRQLTIC